MLASLPTNVPEAKHGPRLMEFIKGEAEALLESIPVEELTKSGGDKKIWQALDDKYGPQPRDLMQQALKGYFYELQVKQSESYTQFLARYDAASRKLKEQGVELPAPVAGYMLLKKLRLDATQESMVMTHSQGSMDFEEIVKAVRGIFPEGKGPVKSKEAFLAGGTDTMTEEMVMVDEEQELNDAAEMMAAEFQVSGAQDEEEVLETFESYAEIRKKLRDQRTNRGFGGGTRGTGGPTQWKLQGTVRGRLEMLKQRTSCHHCQAKGHWKRECPLLKSKTNSSASTSKGVNDTNAVEIVGHDVMLAEDVWRLFELQNDEADSGTTAWSPTHEPSRDVLVTEVFAQDGAPTGRETQPDSTLGECAVPDTACRRTLVGAYTLQLIEQTLRKFGLKVLRRKEVSEFRFGNSETVVAEESAIIPACIGDHRFLIRASILETQGRCTPLLLSKELLKQLNCVLDLVNDRVLLFGRWISLMETEKGHYGLRCFDFGSECFSSDEKIRIAANMSKEYHIDELEHNLGLRENQRQPADPAQLDGAQEQHGESGAVQDVGEPSTSRSTTGQHGVAALGSRAGPNARHGRRWEELNSGRSDDHPRRQVWEEQAGAGGGGDLHSGQELCQLDSSTHPDNQLHRDAAAEGLCGDTRSSQERAAGATPGESSRHECDAHSESQGQSHESCASTRDGRGGEHGMALCHDSGSGQRAAHHGECGRHASPNGEPSTVGSDRRGKEHDRGDEGDAGALPSDHNESSATRVNSEPGEHVMSKKSKVRLKKDVDSWCVRHGVEGCCDVGLNGDDHNGLEPHDLFVVDIQRPVDFAEVFSPPRILPVAEKRGLKGLRSYDLSSGWNFLDAECRRKCLEDIEKYKPELVTVCPPCGPFSPLQACSLRRQDPEQRARKLAEGRVLLGFTMQVCMTQHKGGRKFLFEHPQNAASWTEAVVEEVRQQEGVHEITFDQCQYGLKDPQNHKLFRKRTRVLTNCEHMKGLQNMCSQDHDHQRVEGQTQVGGRWVNRSRCAQVYPKRLVDKIVGCFLQYKRQKAHEVLAVEALHEDRTDLERSVRRCHVNLGHPSKERFLHMLKSAKASNRAMEIANKLKCSICESHKPYPSHAVSKHKRAEGFNQQLNMDTFEVEIFQKKRLKMLNLFCEGTGLQICTPLWKGATAKEVRGAYRKYWKRWAGNPVKVFTDGGTEFDSVVQQGFEDDGVYVEKTAAYSPWQAGYVERHGGIWKNVFAKAFDGAQPQNKKEVNELIDNVNVAKKSMMRKHGFAPVQHVFGCDLRLPLSLTDDNPNVPGNSGVIHGDETLVRANQIRLKF